MDTNPKVVSTINSGKIHIVEPTEVVKKVTENGFLRATDKVEPSDVFIIAVPTPINSLNQPDLQYVMGAIQDISSVLSYGNLIILESTCPPGTSKNVLELLKSLRPDLVMPNKKSQKPDIHFAYCPERVMPGNILYEIMHNDRVIGGATPKCSELVKVYETISSESV